MPRIRRGIPKNDLGILNRPMTQFTESAFVTLAFDVQRGEAALREAGIPFAESRYSVFGMNGPHEMIDFRTRPQDWHRAVALLEDVYNNG